MKVKLIATQQDRENGFSSVNEYNPIDINRFPVVKEEILGDNSRRISKPLAISVYSEDLRLPNYILNDIYSSVEQLIRSKYPFLEEYIEDFALIASYLNRYSENNTVWSEEFHRQMKKREEEISKGIRFINKLQEAGMDISSISVKYKEKQVPETLEFTTDAMMKMWISGFALEFKKYLKSYRIGLEDRDTNKIQNEYYAPMLKAYFELIYNEGLFHGFKSVNNALLFFGYLCEIAGAFIYDMSIFENVVRKKENAKTKPVYKDEVQKLEKRVQQAVAREKKKLIVSNVNSIRKILKKHIGIDVATSPEIDELSELCSLREYAVYHNVKAGKLLSVNYISAAELVIDRYRYHRDKLDALLQ